MKKRTSLSTLSALGALTLLLTACNTDNNLENNNADNDINNENTEQNEAGEEAFNLTIFHTNDTHGRTNMYPHLITTLNEAKEEYGEGLLLDAGDVFSGTLYFNEFRGQDAVEFMNLMEYDAFVPGNHEFDLGDPEEGHPELAAFFQAAEFPIVAANIDFSADSSFDGMIGDSISSDPEGGIIYNGIIVEHDGEQIGIFGLDTEDTLHISSPGDVTFNDYIETAQDMVNQFEAEGVNKIIALTHLGYDSDPNVGNDLLLAEEVEGIDVIIGGHSHTQVAPPTLVTENAEGEAIEPTVVSQAGEYGQFLGVTTVAFDENGVVVSSGGELLATEDREPDSEAAELLEPYTDQIEELQTEPAGSTVISELPNPRHGEDGEEGDPESVRADETALGNLISDAQLAAAQSVEEDTIMALQNGGGIRAPLAEGEVTIGELIEVQPFGNRLTLLELTGEELIEAFEASVYDAPEENGGFLQVSSGTRLTYDSSEEPGQRVVSLEVDIDGDYVEIDEGDTYTVATNNFTATGGDDHAVFGAAYEDGRGTIVGFTDWEMLRDFMAELGDVDYKVEGRIVDLSADDE
ncbi:5'-nucleotidase C-terminal domain-containing protein [Salipaludibacillus sp. LMS25]|jgi:2',3'-cyclic-nucleotide 2'-phosphodiesterase (5'-nucleotidase family)|uniref:bifunctional metallophosphatase/5'-nucleotidase n=1 Tax=Salipaludibacillus sp. LMS25 TaxID=2924031 RepID=UPI0020D168DE|nr:5'-nucleotidase C-terminal domain-containing protein [Salipaludibacillus sp. LMS25]UTR13132.1 5'-nucleotidase C-terminal domain-containing protein [Salipaludibacillus sp. LMS25]